MLLVGFARVWFDAGSISRLVVSTLVSLTAGTFVATCRPYRSTLSNFLAITTSFMLSCILLL